MYIMHNFHIQYATAFTTFLIKQFKAKGRNLTMREGFLILSLEVLSKQNLCIFPENTFGCRGFQGSHINKDKKGPGYTTYSSPSKYREVKALWKGGSSSSDIVEAQLPPVSEEACMTVESEASYKHDKRRRQSKINNDVVVIFEK